MVKPSERLGNYEVATAADGSAMILGSGAGGVTYRGRHIHLGTEVAIKVLVRRKNLLQKDRDAFLSEARAAASLTHPQIARILDFGESALQHPYYVMELCEGGSLEEFGRKTGPPDESTCIQWLFESASALAHAHQKGILHRDIKPSNLLVARENESAVVKLIDFGLADHADQAEAADHVIGTPHFAAPEQLRGHAEPASDVFSLGATFLWLMTGNHLSQGDVKAVIAERLEAASYTPRLAALPAAWQNLLGRMLDVDPSRRPRDGGEVLAALHALFPHHSGQAVAWTGGGDFPGAGPASAAASQWQDFPDAAWSDRWAEAGAPTGIEHGVSLRATRPGAAEPHDVLRFTDLPAEITGILTTQADLVARHAAELGLGEVILERGPGWHCVAWPALPADDALSWVRQGQSASTGEILAALDPIAAALDGMKPGGFEPMEVHPSMLAVRHEPPLIFSLAVPLPVLAADEQAADSAGTMRGAMGAGLSARFASCVYQLLSGRTPPPAAFVNARAYQAIPKLTERSNRFLSSAIAGTLAGGTCGDVIRGLAHEERIPGASLSGALATGSSAGSRTAASWRSNPAISMPAAAGPSVSQVAPAPPAPPPAPPPPPAVPPAPPVSPASKTRKPPVAAIAAVAVIVLAAGTWAVIAKSRKPTAPPQAAPPTVKAAPEAPPQPAPAATPQAPATSPPTTRSVVKVPGDAASVTEALALCEAGGTIEIAGGTHSEALVLTKSVSLVSKTATVFEDSGLGSSLVTARGPIQITLRNIHLKNTQRQAETDVDSSPSLVLVSDGAAVVFDGCVIEGSLGKGVSLAEKAAATFSNCRIRKNRGTGLNLSSGAKAEISLSEIQENGWSGIAMANAGTTATLGSGTIVSANSQQGVEVGNGAELHASGAEFKGNQKVGLVIEGGGSLARLEASCVISENRKYGAGVRDAGRLFLSGGTVEDNGENGIYIEGGGQAEIVSSTFKSNGTIGVYLVEGSASAVTLSKCVFESHAEAGAAIVGGAGNVSECRFINHPMALYFGQGSSGAATGNSFHPGPIESALVIEKAGEVALSGNNVAAGP
jgi:hypothetical protein